MKRLSINESSNIGRLSIYENMKQAKQYVQQGKMTQEELDQLIKIDPSDKNKYLGWMAKVFVKEKIDIDDLRNNIEEYHVFLEKGKAKTKDIFQFKTFKELKDEVTHINNTGAGISVKDLEEDYEVVVDNEDLYIAVPHTHEASRKLGLTKFSYRECGDGKKDSAWCTTFKAPDHFNSYYYSHNVTFYYVYVRSEEMRQKLKKKFGEKNWEKMVVTALCVLDNGMIDAYDGADKQFKGQKLDDFLEIIGLEK